MDFMHYKKLGTKDWWWFTAKGELIDSFIKNSANVLNIGASTSSVFSKYPSLTVVDIDKNALDMNCSLNNCKRVLADVQKLPFEENSFDAVVISEVLEHVEDDAKAMQEIGRVLKKNGVVVITVPAFPSLFGPHDIELGHLRRYSKEGLKNIAGGLSTEVLTYWNFFLSAPIYIMRVLHRAGGRSGTDIVKLHPLLNGFFLALLRLENFLIGKGARFPFGISLLMVLRK